MKSKTSHLSMEIGSMLQSFICIMGPVKLHQIQFIKVVKKALIQDFLKEVYGAMQLTSPRIQVIAIKVMHLMILKMAQNKCSTQES